MTTTTSTVPTIAANIAETLLTLEFSDGQTLRLDASLLSDTIQRDALMHGLKQKLVDAAAIARNPDTGRSATVADKFDAVKEVYDRLLTGEWNKTREGGATGGLLLRALMEFQGKDRATVKAWLATKTDDQKAALRKNPKITTIIASLKPEPKTEGIDTDSLLDELGNA